MLFRSETLRPTHHAAFTQSLHCGQQIAGIEPAEFHRPAAKSRRRDSRGILRVHPRRRRPALAAPHRDLLPRTHLNRSTVVDSRRSHARPPICRPAMNTGNCTTLSRPFTEGNEGNKAGRRTPPRSSFPSLSFVQIPNSTPLRAIRGQLFLLRLRDLCAPSLPSVTKFPSHSPA